MNNQAYIEKWLAGTLSKEEEALFRQTQEFRDLQRMDNALKRFKPAELNWNASFEKISSLKSKEAKVVSLNWPSILRVAAVLVLGVSVLFYFSDHLFRSTEMAYSTGAGETIEVTLPDNSVVTLNAKSSIAFSKEKWNDLRKVRLEGEAYFAVQKGEQFKVVTHTGTVSVLGTQFNIKDRNDFYEVICYEGKVLVDASAIPVQLTTKQYYREVQKQVIHPKVEVTDGPAWFNDESAFESVPYREVLDEIARQYDVKVSTEKVDLNQLYTGRFPNSDLTTALKAVTMPFGLTYLIKGKEIMVVHAD